jgi:hypothetical protein
VIKSYVIQMKLNAVPLAMSQPRDISWVPGR